MRLKCDCIQECVDGFRDAWGSIPLHAGGSCASSQGRDTVTIGIISNISVWDFPLPENYSQYGRSTGKSNNSG